MKDLHATVSLVQIQYMDLLLFCFPYLLLLEPLELLLLLGPLLAPFVDVLLQLLVQLALLGLLAGLQEVSISPSEIKKGNIVSKVKEFNSMQGRRGVQVEIRRNEMKNGRI